MFIQPGVYVTNKDQNTRDSHLKVAQIVSIEHPEVCQGLVSVGDDLRRLNGSYVDDFDFKNQVSAHAKFPSRPFVIHFLQSIRKPELEAEGRSSGDDDKRVFKSDIKSPPLYLP